MAPMLWIILGIILAVAGWMWWRPWRQRRWLASRSVLEDTLKVCYQALQDGHPITMDMLAGALHVSPLQVIPLLQRLERDGVLARDGNGLSLTADGARMAVSIVRAHRLLERYLADETTMPAPEVHTVAHRQEHRFSADQINRLDAQLGHPRTDPHGDPIPAEDGSLPARPTMALLDWPVNKPAHVAHIEDEPESLYAQLIADGLRPGLPIRVLARAPEQVVLLVDEREVFLAPVAAAQVQVQAAQSRPRIEGVRLSEISHGARHAVVALDPACQGMTRRRLLDLGLTPGATVEIAMTSPLGDPTAYRIRDAMLALRREQASLVWVSEREVSA